MQDEITGVQAAKLSRSMSQEERKEAIYRSSNVIGYDRFMQVSQQVALREAYRKLIEPEE